MIVSASKPFWLCTTSDLEETAAALRRASTDLLQHGKGRRRRSSCGGPRRRGAALAPVQTTGRRAEGREPRSAEARCSGLRHDPKTTDPRVYDAFNARDGPAVADLLVDDVVYEDRLLG